jgi:hypothetical protein
MTQRAQQDNRCPLCPPPFRVQCWARSWWLIGDGPSYLLFRNLGKEVTHLSGGMHRELRQSLKGYRAIRDGELAPLVGALSLASAEAIYDVDSRANASQRKWAAFAVVREIERVLRLFPKRTTFEKELRRLATSLRAAGQYAMYHAAPGVPESESPPGSFFARDIYGQRWLVTSNPRAVYRCESDSPVAECAQSLWRHEQARWGSHHTVLYRVPTRKELRLHLSMDEPAITKLCQAKGFVWLPRATRIS